MIKVILTIAIVIILTMGIVGYGIYKHEKSKISFRDALRLTGLPVITFTQDKLNLNFILDSGATHSVLDERTLNFKTFKYKDTETNECITGLENVIKDAKIITTVLSLNGKNYNIELRAANYAETFDDLKKDTGVRIVGLLGNDFLESNKYVINYKNHVCYGRK